MLAISCQKINRTTPDKQSIQRDIIMVISKEQSKELSKLSEPLLEWLNNNTHPHCKLIIDTNSVELLESSARTINNNFILD